MPAIRGSKSTKKTRRHRRDLDQVHEDLRDPAYLAHYKDTKAAEDLPGLGHFYCTECAKWFESEDNMIKHTKGKPHKRRLRQLKEEPYTQESAMTAAGYAPTKNGRRPDKIAMDIDEEPASDPAAALIMSSGGATTLDDKQEATETHKPFFLAPETHDVIA